MTKFGRRLPAGGQYRCSEEKGVMETLICMKIFASRSFRSAGLAGFAMSLLALSGCSSGNSSSAKPQVGAIAFTDANGSVQAAPVTSLTVNQGTYLDVALTSDPQMLGADWSVVCGSALPPGTPLPPGQTQDQSCGTFTPAHTMSGPIPSYVTSGTGYVAFYTAPAVPPKQGTVTLYASATSDHTKFSTVTLTITGLSISVGFAPAPPATLGAGGSTQFKAVLNNDATNVGVNWSVICAVSACGSFSPAQTASGVVTTYTAPATLPAGGTVQVTATSIADPTKAASATIQIVPISVSVTPSTLSVGTAGTGSLTATVMNDAANKGADWTVSCTNATTPGNCGTVTPHTESGATATYTAPSVADIAVGSTVVLTAASTTDPTKSATATVTTVKGNLVTGMAQAAQQPVSGAQVTLYAATTTETTKNATANASNASAVISAMTEQDGSFSIPYGYVCPTPDTQMYLVSTEGSAGGGTNSNLALMAALGSCSSLDASRIVINEASTAAAVYALSNFMGDAQHVGSGSASPAGMAAAFGTARDLVDVTTGMARTRTVSGAGVAPQAKIDTLANLLSVCAKTAGSTQGDGSPCDQLFHATNPGATPAAQANNTVQALLDLARNATGFVNDRNSFATLYELSTGSASFGPVLFVEPSDWTLAIQFPNGPGSAGKAAAEIPLTDKAAAANGTSPSTDAAGNVWVKDGANATTEFVGGASCKGAPKALTPIANASGSTP
jgi:hypothetical protein